MPPPSPDCPPRAPQRCPSCTPGQHTPSVLIQGTVTLTHTHPPTCTTTRTQFTHTFALARTQSYTGAHPSQQCSLAASVVISLQGHTHLSNNPKSVHQKSRLHKSGKNILSFHREGCDLAKVTREAGGGAPAPTPKPVLSPPPTWPGRSSSSSQGPARAQTLNLSQESGWDRGCALASHTHRVQGPQEGKKPLGGEEFPDQRVPETGLLCAGWEGVSREGGRAFRNHENTKNIDIDAEATNAALGSTSSDVFTREEEQLLSLGQLPLPPAPPQSLELPPS